MLEALFLTACLTQPDSHVSLIDTGWLPRPGMVPHVPSLPGVQLAQPDPADEAAQWRDQHELNASVSMIHNETTSLSGRLRYRVNATNGDKTLRGEASWVMEDNDNRDRTLHRATGVAELSDTIGESSWKAFLRHETRHDNYTKWDTRLALYAGGMYQISETEDFDASLRLGIGGRYETGTNDWTPESIFGGSLWKYSLTELQSLRAEFNVYPELVHDADYRFEGLLEWQIKLTDLKGAMLTIGVEDEYQSDYRDNGRDDGHIFRAYTGVGYRF